MDAGPRAGHTSQTTVERDRHVVTIDCAGRSHRAVNDAVRMAREDGGTLVRLLNVNGQRYIGTGVHGGDLRVEVHGTPGQALAMFMDGPAVEVFGNAQDGVGDTMNGGRVVIHGSAGDVLGYGMRRGRIFVEGDAGYRAGIHMKAGTQDAPVIVCGGKARDFLGEYMAGGLLVVLGMRSRVDGPVVGRHVGAGMHGGRIFVRGAADDWCCGAEVGVSAATDADKDALRPVLADYCRSFGMSVDEVLSAPLTRVEPTGSRPYAGLYAYM